MRARFGEFLVDFDARELTRCGEPVHLSKKAFELLELLIQNAPRALTKEEMYGQIWGDEFVEEANLPNLVAEARSALGDSRRGARFIKTVHGYGYAFSGALELDATPSVRPLRSHGTLAIAGQVFVLRDGDNVVGRSSDATVRLDLPSISRRHAVIRINDDRAEVEDLESKNGTFVDDERVQRQAREIRDRAMIRFGSICGVIHFSGAEGTTATDPAVKR